MLRTSAVSLVALALLVTAMPARATTLELSECRISAGPGFPGIKARCGTMARPENPEDPASEEITLRVAVVAALNLEPATDPVVPLAGGPGQGSVQFYALYANAFEPLRRNRDILLVDQRGTGESSPMECPVDVDVVAGEYSTEETVAYMEDCLSGLPHDARYFTTSVAVTDLDAVREALGYTALNLYGISYGTRVAQHYARRYPDTTRTVVLDGVVPPQLALGPEIATESQKAIDRVITRCTADAACDERFPDLDASFSRLVARLRNDAVLVDVPHPNTGRREEMRFGTGEFAGAVRLLAYHPNSIALLPLMIHEAASGNFEPLASQYRLTVIGLMEALSLGMHNSVMCTEDVPFYDNTTIDYEALAATYMGTLQLDALQAICSIWPAGPLDPGFRTPLETDIPVLLLSGDADPITPPRYADLAAVGLSNARHLVGKDQGHGQIPVGCTSRLVASFVDSADPGSLEADCLERSFVMPFFLDFAGPEP